MGDLIYIVTMKDGSNHTIKAKTHTQAGKKAIEIAELNNECSDIKDVRLTSIMAGIWYSRLPCSQVRV